MDKSTIKRKLLADLDKEWAHVERMCYNRGEAEMLLPVEGQWTFKDILCHLSAWEKYLLDRLGYILSGQQPVYPAMSNMDDVHRFNAEVYAENKDRPLASVKIEFRTLNKGVVTMLEAMDDELLAQPYSYDFPADHLTVQQLIRANTFEHYREHCAALESR